MDNMSLNFIKTRSEDTAQKLRNLGLQEVTQYDSEFYTFINNRKFVFTEKDKCFYSNMLYG